MNSQQKWDLFYSQKIREEFHNLSKTQLDEILIAFPHAKSALDIGCGEGQLINELEHRGLAVTGVDPSVVALKVARKQTTGNLIQGTFEDAQFEPGTLFDIIFVKFVISFIEDYAVFFKKIDTLLNSNGGLIILTPVINRPKINDEEEIFVSKSILNQFLPIYFKNVTETVIHEDNDKKLSLFICKKNSEGLKS